MRTTAIALNDLQFRWSRDTALVLDISELSIMAGERVFLRGPSGSGKTTLLNVLGGVMRPQRGTVIVSDTNLADLSRANCDVFRADHIGFIFQQFNLVPYLGLVQNVILPCRFSKRRRTRLVNLAGQEAEARRLLSHMQLDMDSLTDRPVSTLSVGQQQRVAAARALIGAPEIIIADEPTSSLNADARSAFLELLMDEVERNGSTLVFVSHDAGLAQSFDRTIELSEVNHAPATAAEAA